MKTLAKLGLAALVAFAVAAPVVAEDAEVVTLEGSVMCAKCALEKAADCQDVLIVADGDAKAEYWIVKNDVSEKFGHACQSEKPAKSEKSETKAETAKGEKKEKKAKSEKKDSEDGGSDAPSK